MHSPFILARMKVTTKSWCSENLRALITPVIGSNLRASTCILILINRTLKSSTLQDSVCQTHLKVETPTRLTEDNTLVNILIKAAAWTTKLQSVKLDRMWPIHSHRQMRFQATEWMANKSAILTHIRSLSQCLKLNILLSLGSSVLNISKSIHTQRLLTVTVMMKTMRTLNHRHSTITAKMTTALKVLSLTTNQARNRWLTTTSSSSSTRITATLLLSTNHISISTTSPATKDTTTTCNTMCPLLSSTRRASFFNPLHNRTSKRTTTTMETKTRIPRFWHTKLKATRDTMTPHHLPLRSGSRTLFQVSTHLKSIHSRAARQTRWTWHLQCNNHATQTLRPLTSPASSSQETILLSSTLAHRSSRAVIRRIKVPLQTKEHCQLNTVLRSLKSNPPLSTTRTMN